MKNLRCAKKILTIRIMSICLLTCLLVGCGKNNEEVPQTDTTATTVEETIPEAPSVDEEQPEEREEPEQLAEDLDEKTQDTEPVEDLEPADKEAITQDTETIVSTETVAQATEVESFVVYLSGIDVWGWVDIQSRSDVNIIAAVNPKTRHIQLINTPRDYYVQMPISSDLKDKLTHAGLYGVENSVGTLENLYGIDINYYVKMNFSGFEAIIDTMGGVDVYSEYDFTVEPIKHYVEGYNHLTGLEALAFVRERHAFASGDNQRGRNQMALVQAMVKKVCSPEFLLNYSDVLEQLTDMFRTNIPTDLMADLVKNQLADDAEWTVDTFSVTGTGGSEKTYSVPGSNSYVMIPSESDINEAKELIDCVLNEVP